VNCLLDTHFVLWITVDSPRLDAYRWLDDQRPWGVSPVSLLELQFLSEVGRIRLRMRDFLEALSADERFVIDEVPLMALVQNAFSLAWTRDPFDRLICAHSTTRRVPLCTVDRSLLAHHDRVVTHLRPQ
jgi:PIN domain nuclease of toxin-antitoxin system